MRRKYHLFVLGTGILLGLFLLRGHAWLGSAVESLTPDDPAYQDVEVKLRPLAKNLGKPQPGEWLAEHKESGQTFVQYLRADPVRKTKDRNTIYICQIGDFSDTQKQVLDLTRDYLAVFFDVPVKITKRLPLASVPAEARRVHPTWGDKQILTSYVLDQVLRPDRPDDALAYLAFTSSDLWPGEGWNFVFGQANLRERVGVWSIYRNGNPATDKESFRLCLRRTFSTAAHETGHILTMQHCTAFECNMNGCNNREESDRKPLHLCPVCLRKLCWNLDVEPAAYLEKLHAFCEKNGLDDEAAWYRQAIRTLHDGKD